MMTPLDEVDCGHERGGLLQAGEGVGWGDGGVGSWFNEWWTLTLGNGVCWVGGGMGWGDLWFGLGIISEIHCSYPIANF